MKTPRRAARSWILLGMLMVAIPLTMGRCLAADDQLIVTATYHFRLKDTVAGVPADVPGKMLGQDLYAWRYETPPSIDNDGEPENVMIWQGPGIFTTMPRIQSLDGFRGDE